MGSGFVGAFAFLIGASPFAIGSCLLGASTIMLRSLPRLLAAPALPFGTAALLLQTLIMEQALPSRRNYSGDDAGRLGRIGNEIAALRSQ